MNEKPQIVVVKNPNMLVSFLEDTFTFGGWILILWFNHRYLAGNIILDLLFSALWLTTAASTQSRRIKKFASKSEAIEFLKK